MFDAATCLLKRSARRLIFRIADFLLLFSRVFHKDFERPESIYILMLKPLGLGDLMMLSPFMLEIARRFPVTPVFLVTNYPQFMDLDGIIWICPDRIGKKRIARSLFLSPDLSFRHALFMKNAEWFIGYFLSNRVMSNFVSGGGHYSPRENHYYQRASLILDIIEPWAPAVNAGATYPRLLPSEDKIVDGVELPEDYICMVPVNNWASRQYPVARYRQVAGHLSTRCTIILLGGNTPEEVQAAESFRAPNVIDLAGKTTFRQACRIIAGARLVIASDSGLCHAAFLCAVPTIAIFGCVPARRRLPLDSGLARKIVALGAGEQCPHFPCFSGFDMPRCKNRERFICLRGIAAETLTEHAERILASPGSDPGAAGDC
jgi:ADP-heptose:LPS heptosyltransferase